jgi:hypothetical protein
MCRGQKPCPYRDSKSDLSAVQPMASLCSDFKLKLSCDRQSVGQSVLVSGTHLDGAHDQIFFSLWQLYLNVERPLWREDGSVISCTIASGPCHSSQPRVHVQQNSGHILLSHLRLPQPGEPGSRIYIPQEQGGPVIPPGTGFPFRRLLRLAGLRWRYSNPPPHGSVLTELSRPHIHYI